MIHTLWQTSHHLRQFQLQFQAGEQQLLELFLRLTGLTASSIYTSETQTAIRQEAGQKEC